MTAIPKILIMLALWLLYTFLVYRGCSEELCTGCGAAAITDAPSDSSAVQTKRYPIDFKWSDATAFTNDGFDALKQGILAKGTPKGILEITGFYFEGEPKPQGYDNMGFARADKVKALFAGAIPDDRIRLKARLIDEREGVRTGYFEAAQFDWITPEETTAQTVEELDDRIIIRFPFGSAEREYDPNVEEYLDKLSKRLLQTGESVALVGHTDNVGSDETNLKLGRIRAQGIKNLLVGKGVKSDQITVDSKGESQPVATNDTEEGRYENRRAELRLIKKQ